MSVLIVECCEPPRRSELATVTKPELIEAVANAASAERRQVETVLNAFFDQVRASAKSGDKIGWPGFGSFSVSERAARTGRNPRTGEAVKIKASKAMKFSSSSQLKDFLNTS